MTNYKEVTGELGNIRINFSYLYNKLLKEKYTLEYVLQILTKDVRSISYSRSSNLDDLEFVLKSDGLYISYNGKIRALLKKLNFNGRPNIDELTTYYKSFRNMNSYSELINSKNPILYGLRKVYSDWYDSCFSDYYKRVEAKYHSRLMEAQKYYHAKDIEKINKAIHQEIDRMIFDDFKEKICGYLVELISYYKADGKRLDKLTEIVDLEKIYYFTASNVIKDNKRKKSLCIRYARNYIEHVRRYIDSSTMTLKNREIGFGYNDKNKYSVSSIVDFLEQNSSYRFRREEEAAPKKIINNLELYDYAFLVDNNTTVVRERLGEYIKYGRDSKEKDLGELLIRKSNYFLSLNPSKIRQGINRYNGYIGFVVGDKVVLEHFVNSDKNHSIVDGEAIYIVDDKDFEKVTSMGKLDVIAMINSGEINATRIYHTGDWEERVDKQLKLKRD